MSELAEEKGLEQGISTPNGAPPLKGKMKKRLKTISQRYVRAWVSIRIIFWYASNVISRNVMLQKRVSGILKFQIVSSNCVIKTRLTKTR